MSPSRGTLINQPSHPAYMPEEEDKQTSLDIFSGTPPRALDLPSTRKNETIQKNETTYHDLEKLYPNAPIALVPGGLVLHRAVLHDLTGITVLLDWLADGEAAIVEMEKLMSRDVELNAALENLNRFIDDDLGGQIVQLTDTRLMLLPPGCRGVKGVETEAFAAESEDLGRGGIYD